MSELINSFVKYRAKRAEIKSRQRAELEAELRPFLKSFGQAIVAEQSKGKRIEDIEYEIGAKNRALVYAAKRAAKDIYSEPSTPQQGDPIEPPTPFWEVAGDGPDAFPVYIDNGYVGTVSANADGDITPPDEWALDSKNASIYREIIKEIKSRL